MIDAVTFETLLERAAPEIRQVAKRCPATTCYRVKDASGVHAIIGTYYRQTSVDPVLLVLIHGRDSALPGWKWFARDPATVAVCGCGHWEWPTEEQFAALEKKIDARSKKAQFITVNHAPLSRADRAPPASVPSDLFDPDEALQLFAAAYARRDVVAAISPFTALIKWLQRGGYQPDWSRYDSALRDQFKSWMPS